MMLKILLDDPKYCDGCPCINHDTEEPPNCNLGYWGEDNSKGGSYDVYEEGEDGVWHSIRPQLCIDENSD